MLHSDIQWFWAISFIFTFSITFSSIVPFTIFHQIAWSIIHFSTSKSLIITPISFIFNLSIIMITRSISKSFPIDHYTLVHQESMSIIHFTISKWNSTFPFFFFFCQYQAFKSTSMIQIHDSFYYCGLFFIIGNSTNLMISKHFQHFLIIHRKSLIHKHSIIELQYYTFSITQYEWNPAIRFHFFTQASLHNLDDGTINMIVTNSRVDKISNVLHRNKKKYEKTVYLETRSVIFHRTELRNHQVLYSNDLYILCINSFLHWSCLTLAVTG